MNVEVIDGSLKAKGEKVKLKGRLKNNHPFYLVCFEDFDIEKYKLTRQDGNGLKDEYVHLYIHFFIDTKNGRLKRTYIDDKGVNKSAKVKMNMKYAENLNSDKLKALCSYYKDYMNYLIPNKGGDGDYVFKRMNYVPKQNSFRYYYEKMEHPKLKFVKIENNNIVKILFPNSRKLQKELGCYNPSNYLLDIDYLLDDYNEISIDLEGVKKFLDDKFDCNEIDYNQYVRGFLDAAKIASNQFNFTVDESTDGRLHSQFQRTTKLIKRFIKLDGKNIAEIDISSSVPTFFASKIKKIIKITDNMRINKDNKYCNNCNIDNVGFTHNMIQNLHKNDNPSIDNVEGYIVDNITRKMDEERYAKFKSEFESFRGLISSGELYNELDFEFEKSLNQDFGGLDVYRMKKKQNTTYYNEKLKGSEYALRFIKKTFLAMLNANETLKKYKRIRDVFEKKFPFISEINSIIKKFDDELEHKMFSYLMLQKEGELMLKTVCKEIKDTYEGIKLLTIHDCLITTEDFKIVVNDIMKDILNRDLDLDVNLKVKSLNH